MFYQRDVHGRIKILPKDKMQFIDELKKRCPNVPLPPNQTFE
ncbi:hypothetical protein SD77_0839 [Bacillus badius]|uniref:Uncharacterized protein n=1 Tax=Bacillus badius TaxID=1455 RepID=A0ABR5AU18_BACBA|nr:hypothetical protein SD77_0839 [Bacillus badius]